MSIRDVARVDAATVRDGWAVLSIFEFEQWHDPSESAELLRAKLATYDSFVQSLHFLQTYYMAPVRVELHASFIAPQPVREICAAFGVVLIDPSTVETVEIGGGGN